MGFSMPMSFMVAFNLSRSLRSSSSSSVSSLRAPATEGTDKVSGRKFGCGSGFLSPPPPNMEKFFQSNDKERLDALFGGGAGFGSWARIESKVVRR